MAWATALWFNGAACVAVAALLFSIATLLVKLSSDDLSAFIICAVTSFGAAVAIFFFALSSGVSLAAPTKRAQALVGLRAFFGACTLLAYYAAVEIAGIRDSTALYFTSPLFTLVFECMLSSRWPRRASMLGAVATAAGALMVSERCICSVLGSSGLSGFGLCETPASVALQIRAATSPSPLLPPPALPPHHPGFRSALAHTLDSIDTQLKKAAWDSVPRQRQQQQQQQELQQLQLQLQLQQQRLERQHQLLLDQLLRRRTGAESARLPSRTKGAHAHTSEGGRGEAWQPGEDPVATLSIMGTVLALSAAATNAMSFITVRALGKSTPTLTLTFWHQAIIACVASASQVWVMALRSRLDAPSDEGLTLDTTSGAAQGSGLIYELVPSGRDAALLLGIFVTLLGAQMLQNRGLAIIAPSRGAAINVLQVVFCFLWDAVILGNMLQASSSAGGLLIVAGVLVLTSQLPGDIGDKRDKDILINLVPLLQPAHPDKKL